ncbi:MAG: succinylglutamate desuccinylase [bacterium]|nr:succinylglutamate desuccinylase [bacterium]
MSIDRHRPLSIGISLLITAVLVVLSARSFQVQHRDEVLYPSDGLTRAFPLSEVNPHLAGTAGDTEVYVYEGSAPGGSVLVLGGTHPSEIAGYMAPVLMIETLHVEAGRVFIIPRANASAATHNEPQEAHPQHIVIETAGGSRSFRFGARFTNPVHQWPDPEVYVQPISGTTLAGVEIRNLNRAFPGIADGNLTERVAWAITELIRRESIDVSFDIHESSPEYPVINAIVASEVSQEIASFATISLQLDGWEFSLEPSPPNFHGLSHREWTDHTDTQPILLETANPAMGRLRGPTNAELAVLGQDDQYVKAAAIGAINVPFDEEGISIERRIARDLVAIGAIVEAFNMLNPERAILMGGWPEPAALMEDGLGRYLAPARDGTSPR